MERNHKKKNLIRKLLYVLGAVITIVSLDMGIFKMFSPHDTRDWIFLVLSVIGVSAYGLIKMEHEAKMMGLIKEKQG